MGKDKIQQKSTGGGTYTHRIAYAAIVTGATGYIGGHLVRALLSGKHEVYAVLRMHSDLSVLPDEICKNEHFHVYRYAEYGSLLGIFREITAQKEYFILFHLAANVISGDHSHGEIPSLISSNLTFGTVLIDAAVRTGVHNVVFTGTYWQYTGGSEYHPLNLYAATKKAFEDILQYYEDAEDLHVMTLLLYDTYGPAVGLKKRTKLLDYLRDHAAENITIALSPGKQRLNYVYIDDVVAAYLRAGNLLASGSYNLCGEYAVRGMETLSLRKIVEMFLSLSNAQVRIQWGGRPYRRREAMIPCESIPLLPGWKPRVMLEDGLRRIL